MPHLIPLQHFNNSVFLFFDQFIHKVDGRNLVFKNELPLMFFTILEVADPKELPQCELPEHVRCLLVLSHVVVGILDVRKIGSCNVTRMSDVSEITGIANNR